MNCWYCDMVLHCWNIFSQHWLFVIRINFQCNAERQLRRQSTRATVTRITNLSNLFVFVPSDNEIYIWDRNTNIHQYQLKLRSYKLIIFQVGARDNVIWIFHRAHKDFNHTFFFLYDIFVEEFIYHNEQTRLPVSFITSWCPYK